MGKDLKNLCDKCPKRPTCMYLCPEASRYVNQDRGHKAPRTTQRGGAKYINTLRPEYIEDLMGKKAGDTSGIDLPELFEAEEQAQKEGTTLEDAPRPVVNYLESNQYLNEYAGSAAKLEIDWLWWFVNKNHCLSKKEKKTLFLYFSKLKTQQELADAEGVSQSAIAHRIERSIEKLRDSRKKQK